MVARPSKAARYLYTLDGKPEYRICYCGADAQQHLHTVIPTPWDEEEKAVSQLAPRAKYPSAKFDQLDKHIKGKVAVPTEDRQARKYGSTELATWPDGKPMMQTRVVLEQPDGELVAIYASGKMATAITKALVEANAPDIEVGGQLDVWWSGSKQSTGGGQPAKLYTATYVPPADDGWNPADID